MNRTGLRGKTGTLLLVGILFLLLLFLGTQSPFGAEEQTFEARITKIYDSGGAVVTDTDRGGRYAIGSRALPDADAADIGRLVEVTYSGGIRETDPAQFENLIRVRFIDE